MSFGQWMLLVAWKLGCNVEELDEATWVDFYEDDYTPEEAIAELGVQR